MKKLVSAYPEYADKESLNCTIQVTEACTLACKYCYQYEKTPARMSLETAKKAIDRLFLDYGKTHAIMVLDFIGGEPFLEADLIEKSIDYWIDQCIIHKHEVPWYKFFRLSICSNGTE